MREGFLFGEYDALIEQLEDEAKRDFSKRAKAMLRKQVRTLRRKTVAKARAAGIKNVSGTYKKSIKSGKVWSARGSFGVRVYSGAPHAHLLEEGHDQVVNPGKGKGNGRGVVPGKGIGRKVGHVDGRYVFDQAARAYVPIFDEAVEDFLDEVANNICK